MFMGQQGKKIVTSWLLNQLENTWYVHTDDVDFYIVNPKIDCSKICEY